MLRLDTADYYQGRGRQERALASISVDRSVVIVHLELAARYESLAGPVGPRVLTKPPRSRH